MKKILIASSLSLASAGAFSSDVNVNLNHFAADIKVASNSIITQFNNQGNYASVGSDIVSASGEFPQGLVSSDGYRLNSPWEGSFLEVMPYSNDEADDSFEFFLGGIPSKACTTLSSKLLSKGFTILESRCDGERSDIRFQRNCDIEPGCVAKYRNPSTRSNVRDLNTAQKVIAKAFAENYDSLNNESIISINGLPASMVDNGVLKPNYIVEPYSMHEVNDAYRLALVDLDRNQCVDLASSQLTGDIFGWISNGTETSQQGVIEVTVNGVVVFEAIEPVYACQDGYNELSIIAK